MVADITPIVTISICALLFVLLIGIILLIHLRRFRRSKDDLLREEENQVYLELDSDEQELYFQSREFLDQNSPIYGNLTEAQETLIQEKGISAFEFQKDLMLTNNDLIIINKTELNFFKKFECSTITNLPIPMKNDVYYFESKIYSLPNPENTVISVGLSIKPYPWFRLPGRHQNSMCYDSTGHRRLNQPFKFLETEPPLPKFVEGDVIGVGYRTRNGTIFLTRNGKKVNESRLGGHIKHFKPMNGLAQIFPVVGANNLCSIHVNLGQAGFVFIEGNVKKWGFAPLEGNGPLPPAYKMFNSDILLERSEVDEDGLEDRSNDFPPGFWQEGEQVSVDGDKFSYNAYSEVDSQDERISLHSIANMIPNYPPSYEDNINETVDSEEPNQPSTENEEIDSSNNYVDEGTTVYNSASENEHNTDHSFAGDLLEEHTEELPEIDELVEGGHIGFHSDEEDNDDPARIE